MFSAFPCEVCEDELVGYSTQKVDNGAGKMDFVVVSCIVTAKGYLAQAD